MSTPAQPLLKIEEICKKIKFNKQPKSVSCCIAIWRVNAYIQHTNFSLVWRWISASLDAYLHGCEDGLFSMGNAIGLTWPHRPGSGGLFWPMAWISAPVDLGLGLTYLQLKCGLKQNKQFVFPMGWVFDPVTTCLTPLKMIRSPTDAACIHFSPFKNLVYQM